MSSGICGDMCEYARGREGALTSYFDSSLGRETFPRKKGQINLTFIVTY